MTALGSSSRGTAEGDLAMARTALTCRMAVATLGSSHPDRVIFTANATQALNTAIFRLIRARDRVVTTVTEHNSCFARSSLARDADVEIEHGGLTSPTCSIIVRSSERSRRPRAWWCAATPRTSRETWSTSSVSPPSRTQPVPCSWSTRRRPRAVSPDMGAHGIDVPAFTGHSLLLRSLRGQAVSSRHPASTSSLCSKRHGAHSADPFQPEAWPEHLEAGRSTAMVSLVWKPQCAIWTNAASRLWQPTRSACGRASPGLRGPSWASCLWCG